MVLFHDLTFGQYVPGNSFIHKLDPRTKLIASLILMTCFLLSDKLLNMFLFTGICTVTMFLTKISIRIILGNLRSFLWLVIFTFSLHLLLTPGEQLINIPFVGLVVTQQGLANGLLYSLRIMLLLVLAVMLTMTTTPIELADSIEKLGSPLKKLQIPVQEFALMLTLSLRFVPILLREAETIKEAQLSRGLLLETNVLQKIKNIIPMIIPLFVSSIRRAEDLAVAMEARSYTGSQGRTNYKKYTFTGNDFKTLAVSCSVFGIVLFFDILH